MQSLLHKHLTVLVALLIVGCGGHSSDETQAPGAHRFRPIDPSVTDLWDRQTTENAKLLREIAAEFNAAHEGPPVKVIQSGDYADIYTKTVAAIKARTLPAMAVAYGNMTLKYANLGAVADIGEFLMDPEIGLSQEEREDFFPAVLEQNRYSDLDGRMFSFPYTKAVLVMYCNTDVLAAAGISSPPKSWDEFLDQCRAVKTKTGKFALCFDVDPSTVNGMIFSMGGEIVEEGRLRYDTAEAVATFKLLETLFNEKLAYQNPPRTFNDQTAFGRDETAFSFRPSSSRPYYELVKEGLEGWLIAPIPQSDPSRPSTVLYGANISIFNTTPEQMRAAWTFIKYFTSPKINVRWALKTGYLPYRKSAVDDPDLQAFWDEWPYNRTAFDCLPYARPEPNIEEWQEVRRLIENATTSVITGLKTADEAAATLQQQVDSLLKRRV